MKLKVAMSMVGIIASIAPGLAADEARGREAAAASVVVKPVTSSSTTAAGDPVVLPQKDAQVVVSMFEIPVGAKLPVHKHPFPRYGYVLEGALQVTNTETGKTEVFKAGDFILESVGHWHQGRSEGQAPTKLLVIDLIEKGANNTLLKD
jgi:quercetin dioxygenase-like cupin family protein